MGYLINHTTGEFLGDEVDYELAKANGEDLPPNPFAPVGWDEMKAHIASEREYRRARGGAGVKRITEGQLQAIIDKTWGKERL